jgi:hypothetical protein
MGPLKLTDDQLSAVMRAAAPLAPFQREQFLQELAAALQGQQEIGDGALYRAIREVQRKHFDPERLDHPPPRPAVAK